VGEAADDASKGGRRGPDLDFTEREKRKKHGGRVLSGAQFYRYVRKFRGKREKTEPSSTNLFLDRNKWN